MSLTLFQPIGQLFKDESVRAVYLVDEQPLVLPELDDLVQRSDQIAGMDDPEIPLKQEETGDLPQAGRPVSEEDIDRFLSSRYSQSGEPELQADLDILNRFSLSYNPESLLDLKKIQEGQAAPKMPAGRFLPYGAPGQSGLAGHTSAYGSGRISPEIISQISTQMEIEDLKPWADKILEKIESHWTFDPRRSEGIQGTVKISVTITKNGEILNIDILESSGDQTLDVSAVNAVKQSVPLPGLPLLYPSKIIIFAIDFEYDV